jgi:exodeoxyribonuclease VII large subunit
MDIDKDKIYSISEFVAFLNADLKWMKARIVGEVGEAKAGPTGHMYFTLKDEKDNSMLNCIMWSSKYRLFGITLEPGKKIVASGNPEVYSQNGRLSFVCDTIELAGEGDIKKQYDELKKKLEKEGVFASENKRPIPKYPHKIGIITSKQGAVIHDFLNNIGKFGFDIKMIDSRVEGQGAVEDLLASIQTFRKKDIDVLVIIRGGGSMESLMPFNNELLVREIIGFPVPVIVGIGHDKDVPLVALAADRSESTPTAVANLLNESWNQALLLLERYERDILNRYSAILKKYQEIENKIKLSLQNFRNNILNLRLKLDSYEKIIAINNPERQLKLGYSIATLRDASGQAIIIRSVKDVEVGQNLEVKVSDGVISSEVKNIK